MKKVVFLVLLNSIILSINAQNYSNDLWTKNSNLKSASTDVLPRESNPSRFELYHLNLALLKENLKDAPSRGDSFGRSNVIISFPNAEGILEDFQIMEASVMEPELQKKYPDIRSYIGKGIDNSGEIIRFSVTPLGLNCLQLSNTESDVLIDPYTKDRLNYMVYSQKDLPNLGISLENDVIDLALNKNTNILKSAQTTGSSPNDGKLRIFRLAMVTTGECSQNFLDAEGIAASESDEVKKSSILSSLNIFMIKANVIFERDLSLTMVLVANNKDIIFLDPATDNLTNDYSLGLGGEGQAIINSVIGFSNYDISNILYYGSGGWSGGRPCVFGKGGSVSGYIPGAESLSIGLFSHEIGHSLGAGHTFNGGIGTSCGNARSVLSSVEPGGGSTIMAYTMCGAQNIVQITDNYFHLASIREMWETISNAGCIATTITGNHAPVLEKLTNFTIPISTPFVLNVTASDIDGDNLTYTWEQLDPELAIAPPISTSTEGPSFRSLPPNNSSMRLFPDKNTIASGNTSNVWEVLPSVARTMRFGVNVRDNNIIGGQSSSDETTITFDANSGPFIVTFPSKSILWNIATSQTITWNVANTNTSPINCLYVNILLSTDGGFTFPIVLASLVPNDGSQEINVPDVSTKGARIKIESAGNVFYAVNNGFISINPAIGQTFVPDDNFEQALINQGYDNVLDDYVLTANIKNITSLDISYKNINTLIGIEDFVNIKSLKCEYNKLKSIDVNLNTNLEVLICNGNELSSLDVSKNTKLIDLMCSQNKITSLDFSNNPELNSVNAISNQLISIDVSKNNNLTYLEVSNNKLISLDVRNNIALLTLSFTANQLTSIDVSKNSNLRGLFPNYNKLNSIDITNNILLERLNCSGTQLISLDISKNTKLKDIDCSGNKLIAINLTNNPSVETLRAANNKLTSIDVSNLIKLIFLDFTQNFSVCIQTSPEQLSNIPSSWYKDSWASYSVDCSLVVVEKTFVPDDNFEQALIDKGFDDVLDDYVLSSMIKPLTSLDISNRNIISLNGIEDFVNLKSLVCYSH